MITSKKLHALWQVTRPHQWLKNTFIFCGLFFGQAWHDKLYLLNAFVAVLVFTCVTSAAYVFNDLCDKNNDRQHPQKKHRPIASQVLASSEAILWMLGLLFIGLIGGLWLSWKVFFLLIAYFCLVCAYSIKLKHIPWVEIFCIVLGFLCRILLGTWGIEITPSYWVICCGFLLALFLIVVKRRSEQLLFKKEMYLLRSVLSFYDERTLHQLVYVSAFICFVVYSTYAVMHGFALTILFVGLGIGRYIFLLHLRGKQGIELDIAQEFFQDTILQTTALLWVATLVSFFTLKF